MQAIRHKLRRFLPDGQFVASRLVMGALLAALMCASAQARALDLQPQMQELVAKFRTNIGRPGQLSLAAALGRDVVLVLNEAYVEAAPGVVASAEAFYHIGSITKQMTAAAILDLIDRGSTIATTGRKITLDSDVASLLDGFEHWTKADSEPITVRRLLTMTSNLPNFTRELPADVDPRGSIDASGVLRALGIGKPIGWPGTFERLHPSHLLPVHPL